MNFEKIILSNFAGCDSYESDSFVGSLHEKSTWNIEQYWQLEAALYALSEHQADIAPLTLPIFSIFSYTMSSFVAHFNQNDLYEIENISSEQARDYLERVQIVFEGVFSGAMPRQSSCFEIQNPLLHC